MIRSRNLVVLAAISAVVAGCDASYGVSRTAKLDSLPPPLCVQQVIKASPGVVFVRYDHPQDHDDLFGSTYTFTYAGAEGSHIRGALQIHDSLDVSFSHSLMMIGVYPPQEDVDATRPVMRHIEDALASQCGMTQLPERIEEECSGVECDPFKISN
jgi:hypothetical protein